MIMTKKMIVLSLTFAVVLGLCSCSDKNMAQQHYIQAVNAYSAKNFNLAFDFIQQSLASDKNFHEASLLKIKILYFQDKNKEALRTAEAILKKYPEFTEAKLWLIRLFIQCEEYEKAQTALKREISFNYSDWRFYHLYALLGEKQKNFELRMAMEKKAEQFLQESSKVYMDIATFWLQLEQRNRAIDYLEKARILFPEAENFDSVIKYIKNGEDLQ